MNSLKYLSTARRKTAGAALLITLSVLSGCQSRPPQKAAQAQPSPPPSPEANILVDEPMLARPHAIIGGAVRNVGTERLEKLSVEIELRRRNDSGVEVREAAVEPADLAPGQQGRFSIKVLSEEWSGSRVVKLRSGARAQEVAFKAMPGAKRPPEKIKENVIVVKTPAQKRSGSSDFINTPDTPYKVP